MNIALDRETIEELKRDWGDTAKVAWASGVRTSCPLSSLRLI